LPNLHLRHSSQTAASTQRSVVTTPRRRGPRPDLAASHTGSPTWVSLISEDKRHSQQLSITIPIGSECLLTRATRAKEDVQYAHALVGGQATISPPATATTWRSPTCRRVGLRLSAPSRSRIRRVRPKRQEVVPHLPCGSRSTTDALSTGRDGSRRECLACDGGGNESRRPVFNPTGSVSGLSRRIPHAAA
jgi:hypothetical protein